MSLPPCRPLFPNPPTLRQRRGPQYEPSRAHSPCGQRLNLNWAVSLLAAIPGPHQQRIVSQSSPQTRSVATQNDDLQQDQQGAHRPSQCMHCSRGCSVLLLLNWMRTGAQAAASPRRSWAMQPGHFCTPSRRSGRSSRRGSSRRTWLLWHGSAGCEIVLRLHKNVASHNQASLCHPGAALRHTVSHAQADVLTRIYPCAECAKHFKDVIRWIRQ